MKHNHYGLTLDTEKPTTGVYNGNQVAWDYVGDQIDPSYGWFCPECGNRLDHKLATRCRNCRAKLDWDDLDYYETESWLLGDWIEQANGKWRPDRKGDFAALYDSNDNYIQVVWSKTTRRGSMCSPCFPGQVDAKATDKARGTGQKYYALPDYALYKES
jgi:hypothetical protein